MNTRGLGETVFVAVAAGVMAIAASSLGALANQPNLAVSNLTMAGQSSYYQQLAQATETGCRQTNSMTGIYTQPSLDSLSRGILNSGQTVRLELVGTGTGWARITAPVVGWVEAKYLAPAATCTGTSQYTPAPSASAPAGVTTGATTGVNPSAQPPAQTLTQTVGVVCEVLPSEGLVVRSEPTLTGNTALYTIPKGVHQFQFTNNHLTSQAGNQQRYWAYITAPYQGWISLGIVGGSFNLGGRQCG